MTADFDAESDALTEAPTAEKIAAFEVQWAGHPGLQMTIDAATQQMAGGIDDWVDLL